MTYDICHISNLFHLCIYANMFLFSNIQCFMLFLFLFYLNTKMLKLQIKKNPTCKVSDLLLYESKTKLQYIKLPITLSFTLPHEFMVFGLKNTKKYIKLLRKQLKCIILYIKWFILKLVIFRWPWNKEARKQCQNHV